MGEEELKLTPPAPPYGRGAGPGITGLVWVLWQGRNCCQLDKARRHRSPERRDHGRCYSVEAEGARRCVGDADREAVAHLRWS